jgi:hypothetical protein
VFNVLAFTEFPLDSSDLDRRLGKGPARWRLPKTAKIDPKNIPKLRIEQFKIAIDNDLYAISPKQDEPSSSWDMALPEFESKWRRLFDIKATKESILNVEVKVVGDSDDPEIELRLVRRKQFLHTIAESLDFQRITTRPGLLLACSEADEILERKPDEQFRPKLEAALEGLSIEAQRGVERNGNIMTLLNELLKALGDRLAQPNGMKQKTEISNVVNVLESSKKLFDNIDLYYGLDRSIAAITIRSARIYYDLRDTQTGRSYPVDIVSFDDTIPAPAAAEGKR